MIWILLTTLKLLRHERAQDSFEYLLVVGVVVVLIVAGFVEMFGVTVPRMLGPMCPGVDPVFSSGPGDCFITPTPP